MPTNVIEPNLFACVVTVSQASAPPDSLSACEKTISPPDYCGDKMEFPALPRSVGNEERALDALLGGIGPGDSAARERELVIDEAFRMLGSWCVRCQKRSIVIGDLYYFN